MTSTQRLPATFWLYLIGMAAAALGDAILSIALPYVTLGLPQSAGATSIASVVLAGTLPRFLGPLLGSIADRTPPHRIFLMTSLTRALCVLVCGLLLFQGLLPLSGLMALAFLNGTLATLAYAAGSAFVPRLLSAAQLPQANSLSSGAMMGLPLVGYGLGGTLLHLLGDAGTLLIAVPLFLIFTGISLSLTRLPAAQGKQANLWRDLQTGWSVLRHSKLLLSLLSLSFTLNLAMNIMNVRSPLHMRDFGRGSADYAVFEMLISGGVLLGILMVTPLAKKFSLDTLIGVGRWVLALGMSGFLWSPVPMWWGAAAIFGIGLGLLEVAAVTRSQQVVPAEVRGRVLGALMAFNALGLTLGALVAGWPVKTSTLMGSLTLLLAFLAVLWPFAIRSAQTSSTEATEA
ncbi:MFS transporter (plasmid) [Deinococcus wulumuqiensis]|uniref:MFS transporter n=1 Tax=Deinococcus wulumuqiensis TaxID=980427 RepID=A0A345ILJ1_9DEIO|nr:MFS transporter [Deinococcus wulumuqiensis]